MSVINTNVASLNAQNNLAKTTQGLQDSLQRLSSGLRINSAKDDAAGLAISNRQTSQIKGLNQAIRNANDGISIAQTAEGAMQESTNILQRMRELSLQSANGSNSASDRAAMQKEVDALAEELTRIAETTSFGGQALLDGSYGTQKFQIGANANETIAVSLSNISATSLGNHQSTLAGTAAGEMGGTVNNASSAFAAVGVAGDLTINGQGVTLAATDTATVAAKAINDAATGVTASTSVSATVGGLSSTTAGDTLTIGTDTFDLDAYGGDLDALASDINKAGHSATVDTATNEINISATDVDGISFAGTAGGATLDGAATAASSVSAGLTLSSGEAFVLGESAAGIVAGLNLSAGSTLSSVAQVDISTADGAQSALGTIDAAIAGIDSQRADLGAIQNRLSSTISNLSNISENVSAARSRTMDADFAKETAELTRNQILQQAGTAMLAQANQLPQSVLSLLG
ncbi:flagellin [Motiliproteus sp. SC1-56]|uniref:flagellin n=1 Tax=Motiliproteus sp. SC1-56 TaxID=2799565 RepID=UPI001A8EE0C0|nr:flagellin [Motiliproteus sp. SC1-56]